MLEWDGVWITLGDTRIRTITPADVVDAMNDIDANREVWAESLRNDPPPAVRTMMLWKSRPMIEQLAELVVALAPRRIFELGIANGGSTAVLGALAPEAKIVAVDIEEPVGPLADHIEAHGLGDRIRPYYGIDQADRATLARIIEDEFGDEPLDLVIDDASHRLDLTRVTLDEVYPRVRPGGCYVIEDWSWAHDDLSAVQDPSLVPEGPPLTALVVELLMALGSGGATVDRMEVEQDWVRVWRGDATLQAGSWTLASAYRTPTSILSV